MHSHENEWPIATAARMELTHVKGEKPARACSTVHICIIQNQARLIYAVPCQDGVTGDWQGMRGFLEVGDILLLDLSAGDMSVLSF